MKILITGGTGFIGKKLCEKALVQGYELWVLTRDIAAAKKRLPHPQIHFIENLFTISKNITFEAIINLAGAPIDKRWTSDYKNTLIESRVKTTQAIVAFIKSCAQPPAVFITGSAIGYYGSQENEVTENTPPRSSFSHQLCQAWESAANEVASLGVRTCYLRTGIVLGPKRGALAKLRLPFKLGLGGKIGSGEQWMSWIHVDDLVRTIFFCIQNPNITGPVNATAPHPVTNQTFTEIYAKVLHRYALLPLPALVVKLLFGQMGEELLLSGQKVLPAKLQHEGFIFDYPDLKGALLAIEGK